MKGKLVRVRLTAKGRTVPEPRSATTPADALSEAERKRVEGFMEAFIGTPKIGPPYDQLPDWAQQRRLWALARPEHYAGGDNEYEPEEFAGVYNYVRKRPRPLGFLPLVVLTRGISEYPPDVAKELEPERVRQQKDLARLSRNGRQIIATTSGHHIQVDDPELVACGVRSVVDAVRQGRRLPVTLPCKAR